MGARFQNARAIVALLTLWAPLALGCGGASGPSDAEGTTVTSTDATERASDAVIEGAGDAATQGDTAQEDTGDAPSSEISFTHKMMKSTGENMFSSLAYECSECTVEQHAAIEVPEGWQKGPVQRILITGEIRSTPSFEGVPPAMDFVEEVEGEEYVLIAKTLSGALVEAGNGGITAIVEVMRDTVLRYPAQSRVHELTSPEGDIFVLFAYEVDPATPDAIDFQSEDALADFSGPTDWTYATRILEEELVLDTPETATVLAIRAERTSSWQRR